MIAALSGGVYDHVSAPENMYPPGLIFFVKKFQAPAKMRPEFRKTGQGILYTPEYKNPGAA